MDNTDINDLLTLHKQKFSKLELIFANKDDSDRSIEISDKQYLTFKQVKK